MPSADLGSVRYDAPTIVLHWLSAAFVLAAIVLIEMKGLLPKGEALRDSVKLWHFQIGALVLQATIIRLGWCLVVRLPQQFAPGANRQACLATVLHGLLYLLLLVLPASGLAFLFLAGKPVVLFGWELPVSAEAGQMSARAVKRLHETLGNLMIVLVAAHVSAALWHRFVCRDGVLARMLPRRN